MLKSKAKRIVMEEMMMCGIIRNSRYKYIFKYLPDATRCKPW